MIFFTIFFLLLHILLVSCYRHQHFTNVDVCDPKGTTKTVPIGDGAIVLSLNNDSFASFDKLKEEKKICNIMIKSRKDLGLMVYAEDVYLRSDQKNSSQEVCIDYIEFGREDIIPFITMERSGKLCGERTGYHYDEPGGQLLIWLKLGPYRPLPNRASLSTARLSLVITPYEKKKPFLQGFRQCKGGKNYWIRNEYFCDGRANCPQNPLTQESSDEETTVCSTTAAPPTTTTQRPTYYSESEREREPKESSSWDFSFIFIALISIVGLLVIACGIVCTLKKCNLGLLPQTPDNCPDTSFGMLELSRMPNRSQENTYIVHPPCPRPERPTDFLVGPPHLSPSWTRTRPAHNPTRTPGESRRPQTPSYSPSAAPSNSSIRMPKQSPLLSPGEAEAPPPSYHDIFPPDYVPNPEVMRGTQNDDDQH